MGCGASSSKPIVADHNGDKNTSAHGESSEGTILVTPVADTEPSVSQVQAPKMALTIHTPSARKLMIKPSGSTQEVQACGEQGEGTEAQDTVGVMPRLGVPEMPRRSRRLSVSAECNTYTTTKYEAKVIPKSPSVRQRIEESIQGCFLFSPLDPEQRDTIIKSMEEKRISAGNVVIREGEPGDYFYVIGSGTYSVWKTDEGCEKKVFSYDDNGTFGELALMYNCPRAATVKADTEGVLWAVDRDTFRHIITSANAAQRKLDEHFIEEIPLFAKLTREERAKVADCLESFNFEDGDFVVRQGEHGDKFYIVEKGIAVATQMHNEEEVEVGRMETGAYFGERAILKDEPRAANVKALGPLKVSAMSREAFTRLLGDLDDIMHRQIASYPTAAEVMSQSAKHSRAPGGAEGVVEHTA